MKEGAHIKCNPYTGDSILTKLNETTYEWRCICKDPSLIDDSNINGNCDNVVACGDKGTLVLSSKEPEPWKSDSTWAPQEEKKYKRILFM